MKKIILCPLLVALLGGCNGGTSNSSTPSLNQSLTTLNSMNGAIPVICNANVQKWQENYTYKNVNTLVIYNGSEFFNNSITNERPDISNQWILLGSCSKESIISPSKVLLNESNNCLNAKLTYQNIGNPWYINYEVSIQNSCSDEKSLKDFSVSMISQSLDGVAIPLPTIHNWWVNGTQYDLAYNSENLLQTGFIINPINAIIKSNQTISFTGGIGLNGVSYDVETAQKSFKYTGATPTPTPTPTRLTYGESSWLTCLSPSAQSACSSPAPGNCAVTRYTSSTTSRRTGRIPGASTMCALDLGRGQWRMRTATTRWWPHWWPTRTPGSTSSGLQTCGTRRQPTVTAGTC